MKAKIMLDAGHYGKYNRSPANKNYYESEMTWKLHLLLKKHLEEYGFEVGTTRADQKKDLEVSERGRLGKGYDLLLSVHSNSVADGVNETVDRPSIFVQLDGKGDNLGKLLADCIAKTMGTTQSGTVNKRRGKRGEYYGVLRGAAEVGTMGIIVEHSFHTNTRSVNWLLSDANLEKMAKAEADVIAEYFGMRTEQGEALVKLTLPKLRKGDKRTEVKTLQRLLNAVGASEEPLTVDGSFGGKTDNAVRALQKKSALDADGVVGVSTWELLLKGVL